MILVLVLVDGRDLTLAKRIVQDVIDLRRVQPQPRGGGAIYFQIHLKTLVLLVGIDVQQFRHLLQGGGDLGQPGVEILERVSWIVY